MTPLRRVHLEQAIAWARGQKHPAIPADVGYEQSCWSTRQGEIYGFGTAFCLHGAAHLIARGFETQERPQVDDYSDCASRGIAVRHLMCIGDSTIDEIEAAMDQEPDNDEEDC